MKLLFWVITAPIVFGAASFAVSNRHSVEITLWPFPEPWNAPLYLVALGMLGTGFILGATITWLSAMRTRLRAGRDARRIAALERELAQKDQQAPPLEPNADTAKTQALPARDAQLGLAKPASTAR